MPDRLIETTDAMRSALVKLHKVAKYHPDDKFMYPGASSEADRIRFQGYTDQLIEKLTRTIPGTVRKSEILDEFRATLVHFDIEDSEDRDRICHYLENIMDIFKIHSSDGLLNEWRYGFDPEDL